VRRDRRKVEKPKRAGGPETDLPTHAYYETLRPRRTLDVKPPEGERGGAATKASARSDGSRLWRVEPQEGIDGRDHS
jgi:hypothetical protein